MKLPEAIVPMFSCPNCGTLSYPFGNTRYKVPFEATVKCPSCGTVENTTWVDEDLRKEVIKKRMLEPSVQNQKKQLANDSLNVKLEEITERITMLQQDNQSLKNDKEVILKEIELLKTKIIALESQNKLNENLLEALKQREIGEIQEQARTHTSDINNLLDRLRQVEEELGFRRNNQ